MSDVKIEPCAWCGKAPETGFRNTSIRCMTIGPTQEDVCCMAIVPRMGVREWNLTQQRILSRRRADFEAGAEFVNNWKLEAQEQVPIWKIREVFNAIVNNR